MLYNDYTSSCNITDLSNIDYSQFLQISDKYECSKVAIFDTKRTIKGRLPFLI